MQEIRLKDIIKAHRNARRKAIRRNRALGLSYLEVEDAQLVSVDPKGKKTVLGKPRFGMKKISQKRFKLNDK